MPEARRAAIRAAILDESADPGRKTAVLDTLIKFVDLNHDGEPEVIAQGAGNYHCSPTGNCPVWVFRRVRDKFTLILEAIGQTFIVEKRARGYSDIVVRMHGSASVSSFEVFRYEKGEYRQTGCYLATWDWTDKSPKSRRSEPEITECPTQPKP